MITLLEAIHWAVFGLIVGVLARFIVPGRDPMGIFATVLIGIAGSFVGGFIGRKFFHMYTTTSWTSGFWMSLLGAIILIVIVRMLRRRGDSSS